MRNRKWKSWLTTLVIAGLTLGSSVAAAEQSSSVAGQQEEFVLDQYVVTAQRYQTRELETPASVEIYDEQRIKATGAANVQEILKYSLGLTYSGMGPGGTSYANSNTEMVIRGMEGGTLVMVNGRPINTRGLAFLDQYPASNVERIEIIRGGGSVLYGTQATGGVINIITKKQIDNSAFFEMGNFDQRNGGLSLQAGKMAFNYNYSHWGSVDSVSLSTWQSIANSKPKTAYFNNDFKGTRSDNIALTYTFSDEWSLFYSYNNKDTAYTYAFYENEHAAAGKDRYYRNFIHRQNTTQLNYQGENLKASLYYNDMAYQRKAIDFLTASGNPETGSKATLQTTADERNRNLGLDVQYDWQMNQTKYLIGGTAQHEYYKPTTAESKNYSRMNYSIYSSVDHSFTDDFNAILALRYSWQGSAPHENLDKLTPQLQLHKKLSEHEYLYASAGMSYTMPTFKQTGAEEYNGNVVGNPDLKPQTGTHYEVGWKRDDDQHGLRVALFKYNIEDNISTSLDSANGTWKYVNEDSKNAGLEMEYTYAEPGDGWKYNVGFSVGNPKTKNNERPGGRSQHWERAYDRYQVNSGIGYKEGNWTVNLLGKYVFGRTKSSPDTNVTYGPEKSKPALYTTLNINCKIDDVREVYLKAENIFDRKDIINNSSSEYYYTPFNFVLGYNVKF